jgi:hypothetical protein
MKRAVKEATMLACKTAANGTVVNITGFKAGASGTGSCTLSDTSLYTFTFPRAFKTAPAVTCDVETAGLRKNAVVSTTTGCTVQLMDYGGTTKTAGIFMLTVVGNRND